MQFGYLLGGTVIVETIFSWPGIGKLLVDSIFARDFSMIQGCVLFIAVLFFPFPALLLIFCMQCLTRG